MVGDGGTGLRVSDTHPSELLLFGLFFGQSDFLLGWIFLVGREGTEVTIKSALVGTADLPFSLVLVDVQLWLSWFFLSK